jgi:hypothetical protein
VRKKKDNSTIKWFFLFFYFIFLFFSFWAGRGRVVRFSLYVSIGTIKSLDLTLLTNQPNGDLVLEIIFGWCTKFLLK